MNFPRITSLLFLLSAMVTALPSCSPQSVSGTYGGKCHNQTLNIPADLHLVITQHGQEVNGTLTITGELYGGGPIAGRLDGNRLTFTTQNSLVGQITWIGKISRDRIQGRYVSELPFLTKFLTGTPNQEGTWEVNRL